MKRKAPAGWMITIEARPSSGDSLASDSILGSPSVARQPGFSLSAGCVLWETVGLLAVLLRCWHHFVAGGCNEQTNSTSANRQRNS